MRTNLKDCMARFRHIGFLVLLLSFAVLQNAEAFTLKVVDDAGNPVNKYRWMVEEDTTNVVTPGTFSARTLGVNIHTTYAPVKQRGHSTSSSTVIDVPANKRWLVSVLPDSDAEGSLKFTAGGHLVEKWAEKVKVVVNTVQASGVLTAQISVFIFNDNAPINNAPDITEPGLGDVSILLFDQAGAVSQDAFGNPLGTDYQRNTDGTFQFNADGSPVIKTPGKRRDRHLSAAGGGCLPRLGGYRSARLCHEAERVPGSRGSDDQVHSSRQVRCARSSSSRPGLDPNLDHRRNTGHRCMGKSQ